ncbi:uncharacterized protein PHACADRAFT_122940 [Phanerochaete carnosa HHB-10118-sp]|uniref:Uncharacterized protein n=1 Tax=Phanerochaete carnosa (strain HHB-10118-sp) TaxID=650164 RepID=K5WUL4_PHACS|nr:uncharacterized protein PHACADRAFT_122940 [Phanerochaete carnosa HHB-10118-sp]EKM54152.1 hypothetical protein PHACADRAFT_122940 [Phanerochaete carnosa HHB-10118-sp]
MARNFVERNVTFWGMVAAVMAALKLKDRWDGCQSEAEGLGHGPVALHSPIDPESGRQLPSLDIDTEIPATRPKRKHARNCCVCCGFQCGLFWKAFGIVCLLFLGWQAIELAIWLITPSPTGLEGMPAYSTSLGCADARHIYNPEQTIYSIPIGAEAEHTVDIQGGAFGTLLLAEGTADSQDIQLEMMLRTDNSALLDSVSMQYPTSEDVQSGLAQSHLLLQTPAVGSSCMRYDMVLRIPPNLKDLTVMASSITQLQFDKDAHVTLDSLNIRLQSTEDSDKHMLLPNTNFHAKSLALETVKGWLVGDISIVEQASLTTSRGDAVMNVHVHPLAAAESESAVLNTKTGNGRADVFYESDAGVPHRQIQSKHLSSRTGDLYLTYKDAEFNGRVDMQAKSYFTRGMTLNNNRTSTELPWVGNKDGGDLIHAESTQGWIGLYF